MPGGTFQPQRLDTEIRDATGLLVATNSRPLAATDEQEFEQNLVVPQPRLWSPETPILYTATSKLYAGAVLKDEYSTRFGIRSFKFEAGKGFSLNGQPRKFKGVCNHHNLGPLGAAVNTSALRCQLTLLKDLGCDAIRTTHNMPAPELVSLCDGMDFMLMVESFDEWKTPKVKNGYSQYFDEWLECDLVNMVQRDRNHPSVILWSIGNEVPDQSRPGGGRFARHLQGIVHREDPTRPITMGMDRFDDDLKNNFASVLDMPGFNYKSYRYPEACAKLPQGYLLGSETASTVSSCGVYKFRVVPAKEKKHADNQSSSYDLEAYSWASSSGQASITSVSPRLMTSLGPHTVLTSASWIWPVGPKTGTTSTAPVGIPPRSPCTCCRTGPGPAAKARPRPFSAIPATPRPSSS